MPRSLAWNAVGLLLVAVSCAPSLHGPGRPIAREEVLGDAGLDVTAARDVAERFVLAYARASQDGGSSLGSLVVGPKLESWVRWLNVQNREFHGTINASPAIRAVDFVAELQTGNATGVQVAVDASVTFTFAPMDAQPFERTRSLAGGMVLVKTGPLEWQVLDATRDGQPMSDGIQILKDQVLKDRGVSVQLDSVFTFAPNWQLNAIVTNHTAHPVALDPAGAILLVKTGKGQFDPVDGVTTGSLESVPAHGSVKGLMAFPAQASAQGRVLVLAYTNGGRVSRFAFPLQGLVTATPLPATTTPGSASVSPS